MNDLAKSLGDELTTEFGELRRPGKPVSIPHKEVSLADQWTTLEKIDRELRDRIRKERVSIIAEYDRSVVEIENLYAEKISNAIAELEQEKKNELRDLVDRVSVKLREHDLLTKRMG